MATKTPTMFETRNDLSAESRDMMEAFSASGYFDVYYSAAGYDEITNMIDSGKAKGVLEALVKLSHDKV